MKRETPFDAGAPLIFLEAAVSGPGGTKAVTLLLDTGAERTTVTPDMIDELGYSPRDGGVITAVRSAIGKEQGYTLRVSSISALGFTLTDLDLHVFDLAERYDFDGLLGLDFLRRFNYEIRSGEGRILIEPV